MDPVAILVHGLWANRWLMAPLARRLRTCGFTPLRFGYRGVHASPEENAACLGAFIRDAAGSATVHLVGHSLGGVVILHLLQDRPELATGRVVLLGTPLAGSRSAARFDRHSWGRWALGRSVKAGLLPGAPASAGVRETGMIAGTLGVGLGLLLGRFDEPGDGVVAVRETRSDALADHLCLPVNHTGLLFSRAVARQTCVFLRCGRFGHGEQ